MASEKKPSIGSAEELEAYGVWVKSEPQDFTASLDTANFNADALPYEADFDTGFDNMGMGTAGFDLLEPELNIPEISLGDEGIITEAERGGEESSTQMLMKIASELSSIRTELNTLKREFAEIRGEGAEGGEENVDPFSGEGAEDEKIALSGDEMESFFNAADFPSEEEMGFDPGREADEAALKELDEQNEAEELHIDYENLGIALDGAATETTTETEAPPEELPPLEAADNDDFEMPSFDALSFDEAPADEASASEPDELEEAEAPGFAEELVPLEGEDEELRALRLEGAEPLAPPPENADYLEDDPFALNNADLEGSTLESAALEESALSEDIVPESALEEPELEEPEIEVPPLEEVVLEDTPSEPEVSETEVSEIEISEPEVSEIEVSEPEVSEPEVSETEISEPEVSEPAAAETATAETADITVDELSFDEAGFDLNLDDFSAEPSPAEEKVAEKAEEKAEDAPVFDTDSLELPEETPEEELDIGVDEPLPDIDSLDLSDAVIDEPNLSEEIVEAPIEEPVLSDISFDDDISLEMDGFETELEVKTDEPPADIKLDAATDDAGTIDTPPDDQQIDDLGAVDLGADLKLDAATDDLGTVDIGEDALDVATDDAGTVDIGEDITLDAATDDAGTVDVGEDITVDAIQAADLETVDLGEDLKLEAATDDAGTVDVGEDIALDAIQADDLETVDLGEDLKLDAATDDLGTVDIGEDIALDTQLDDLGTVDFGADLEPEADLVPPPAKAAGKPDRAAAAPANDIISDVDDSVIPEGFEVNAKEADPSLDDDLEAFAGELSIAGDDSPSDSADKLADDSGEFAAIPQGLKNELKNVLSYMDHLLESLPEDKIEEFAQSEYFDKYKKIFKELGLV